MTVSVLALLTLAACGTESGSGSGSGDGSGTVRTDLPVTGVHWNVDSVTVGGKRTVAPDGAHVTITPDGRATGNFGCNHFTAPVRVDGDTVTVKLYHGHRDGLREGSPAVRAGPVQHVQRQTHRCCGGEEPDPDHGEGRLHRLHLGACRPARRHHLDRHRSGLRFGLLVTARRCGEEGATELRQGRLRAGQPGLQPDPRHRDGLRLRHHVRSDQRHEDDVPGSADEGGTRAARDPGREDDVQDRSPHADPHRRERRGFQRHGTRTGK